MPADWVLPPDWESWAEAERQDLDITSVACQFRDYWVAKPGKDGRKLDWHATWRNWVRGQRQQIRPHSTAPPSKQSALEARNAANVQRILETINAPQ